MRKNSKEVTKKTPKKEITIQGFTLQVPAPFAEGHVLNETEAQVLNQTLAENLRNNFGSQIRKSREEAEAAGEQYNPDPAALQKALDDYVAEYEFGIKRTRSGVVMDPVERKARSMAKAVIKRAIQDKGVKISQVGNEKINELADSYFQANSEILLKQAKEVLEADARAKEALATVNIDL